MEHCDKGPQLERIEGKLDTLAQALSAIAVQGHRLTTLETVADDHECRVRALEGAPVKRLERMAWMLAGGFGTVGATVIIAVILWKLGIS